MKKQIFVGLIFYVVLFVMRGYAKAEITGVDQTQPATVSGPIQSEADIVARGKYIFDLSGCVHCHTIDKTKPLAGGYNLKSQFGTFLTPNISQDKKTGIGSWSEAQFIKALREGISPKGEYYYPSFPYTNYSKLSDEDLRAMRQYMLTLPAVEQENQKHILKFPYDKRKVLFFWRALNFRKYLATDGEDGFLKSRGVFEPLESRSESWNRGAYLVEGAMHCTQCHTPRNKIGGLETKKWMSGAPIFGKTIPAPNLTMDDSTGLGTWKVADWRLFLKEGITADGDVVGGDMGRIISVGTSHLTDTDMDAVISYFQSLKPVTNSIKAAN